MTWTTPFSLVAAAFSAVIYARVAVVLHRRAATATLRAPIRLFQTWWTSLAALSLAGPVLQGLHELGWLQVWLYQTFQEAVVLAVCVALWALMGYLLFLYTGSRRLWAPLAILYGIAAFGLLAVLEHTPRPEMLVSDGWTIRGDPEPQPPAWVGAASLVLLLLPVVIAAAGLLNLLPSAETRMQRFRLGMIAGSILVWFGASFVAGSLEIQGDGWQVTSRLLGIVAASAALAAYSPPRWLAARLRLEESAAQTAPAGAPGARREAKLPLP